MKPIFLSALAAFLGLYLSYLTRSLFTIVSGVPVSLMFKQPFTGWLDMNRYEGVSSLAVAFCLATIVDSVCVGLRARRIIPIVALTLAVAYCVAVRFTHPPSPLSSLRGLASFPEYLGYYALVTGGHALAGYAVGRLWRADQATSAESDSPRPSSLRRPHRHDLGFTLVELLVVIAIIAVLSSLLFAVFARSKRQAKKTDDISKLHQTYLALTLYENDHDGASPASLVKLAPSYIPWSALRSGLDPREERSRSAWPANAWVSSLRLDGDNALLASPNLVSFAYLRPFGKRFPSGNTFEGYRNDPWVGLLLDPVSGECRGEGCLYPSESAGGLQHPPYNPTDFYVVRTDGSLAVRVVPRCYGESWFSYEQMFLFWPIECSDQVAQPG